MVAVQSPRYVPYDEFLRMETQSDERHEWVDGVVRAMTRGTPEHGRLGGRFLLRVFGSLLDENCELFLSDTPIFIEAAQLHTYADVSIVCGPLVTRVVHDRNGKSIGEAVMNPTLIVEVLSDSTERYDRGSKFDAYKKLSSLKEYVLVSQNERRIEVRSLRDGEWTTQIAGAGQSIHVHGRDVAVDAIYG
ncbi:Uma2 family endonuclease [Pendulispora albinea]|uniref:Uma2 family endonuclease n=1 Tax=Pendulispora albinea TaxID=2741071 RepID=A0ABZ2M441_9BACT